MTVLKGIEDMLLALNTNNPDKHKYYFSLWNEIKKIIEASNAHLSQITYQLYNFDNHDEKHCAKVLKNIELLIGEEKINKLSLYELILIYSSAYLHDSAMALPSWEYNLLVAVEGTEKCHDVRSKLKILNDLKPPQSLAEIIEFINNNKKEIYDNYGIAKKFIFSIQNEEEFCLDLAERLQDYETFRNKYSDKLNELSNDTVAYLNYSELIRNEYIRCTHHIRVEKYIRNIKSIISSIIGMSDAERFVSDLSLVCRSHGENIDFVYNLDYNLSAFGNENSNLQFVFMLLRLGDVIHFSSDRAPLSLFAEKKISDPESLKHWNAKFQELKYTIEFTGSKTTVNFSAYCNTPEIYYFIQEYMDWIDYEINNYHNMMQNFEYVKYEKTSNYNIELNQKVNRDKILSNKDVFVPENNLKFTLEQSKILELLMGVQLYKNKFLCLRELYQNSMDACICMDAQNKLLSRKEEYIIEFGLKKTLINDVSRKYIYCFDNGTGMTINIIKNYLLRIGNSYYKSKEFIQQNTNWNQEVKPTSQFGIGILSCYMIADKIEFTTKHYSNGEHISFSLDGPNEHFYYVKPNKLDVEKLGSHGTLIKLFLNDECSKEVNDFIPEKLQYKIHAGTHLLDDKEKRIERGKFQKSLFYLINSQIGICKNSISINVRNINGEIYPIIPDI